MFREGEVVGSYTADPFPLTSEILFNDCGPSTDFSNSEKSAAPIENRIGGRAGAMNVEWEVC